MDLGQSVGRPSGYSSLLKLQENPMSKFIKAAIIAVGSSFIFSASAQADDYTLKLRWDGQQSAEQNYKAAEEKIDQYCKIQVRRESGLNIKERSSARSNCQDQLLKSYIKLADKETLARSNMSLAKDRLRPS